MFIKKVGHGGYYDIFLDGGWEKWTRVQIVKEAEKGFLSLRYVKGRHLPASFVKKAASLIITKKGNN